MLLEGGVTEAGLTKIIEDFHNAYEQEYTYRLDALVEMVGNHLVARVEVGKLEMVPAALGDADAGAAKKGMRQADYALEGKHDATIYDGEKLMPGMTFDGPAVVEDPGTTIVIHPGNRVTLDAYRNIYIELEASK